MFNVYDCLRKLSHSQQYFSVSGNLATTCPHNNDNARIVKSNSDRGTFKWGIKVAKEKPELYFTMRDINTYDSDNSAYDWTNFIVARYEDGHFSFVNNAFEARLTKETYEEIFKNGFCQSCDNLNQNVNIDFSHACVFDHVDFDENYLNSKILFLSISDKLKQFRYLRSQATKFFKKNNIDFVSLVNSPSEPSDFLESEQKVKLQVPYNSYTVNLEGGEIVSLIDTSLYRTKVGRSFVYTEDQFNAICSEIAATQIIHKSIFSQVRVIELAHLEHSKNPFKTDKINNYKIVPTLEEKFETFYVTKAESERFQASHPKAVVVA